MVNKTKSTRNVCCRMNTAATLSDLNTAGYSYLSHGIKNNIFQVTDVLGPTQCNATVICSTPLDTIGKSSGWMSCVVSTEVIETTLDFE